MTVESSPGAPALSVPFAPLGGLTHQVAHHAPLPPPEEDPLWFQRAVFYEVLIRGFFDGNNDGVGDIPGLIAKLDYLQWLGVDCLWLLPFYPSPLRDGGYDISDYYSVHPESGTVDDLKRLLEEAHARGIRVIADLVINHTSDQNPWFLESRSSRDNPKADWYVWNDDDQRWPEARVVFIDVERSNWAYDAQRDQYYWHRFYSHQPDLNYDNPEVADAMLERGALLARPRASTASGSTPFPSCSKRTARRGRTCPRPTPSSAGCARSWTTTIPAGSCWPRPTGGRRTWPTTSATTTSATCASTSR